MYNVYKLFLLFSERSELRTTTNANTTKKEPLKETWKDEVKPKDTDTRVKRSSSSVNGNKENGEMAQKVINFLFWESLFLKFDI